MRLNDLNNERKERITNICLEFSDRFHNEGDDLQFNDAIKLSNDTNITILIFTKNYRYPPILKPEVGAKVNKMLDQGIIQPSSSFQN